MINFEEEQKKGDEVKLKVEAMLFAGSRKFDVEELSKLCKENPKDVKKALKDIEKDYSERETAIMLQEQDGAYKLHVKDDYVMLVSNIITETDLSKTVMETLAVIAFKHPILQADLIKIRTNKAYDHLSELEEAGYIAREKFGRTRKIKLTQKFFDYFDLPPEKLKNAFSSYEAVEQAIEEKEKEVQIANKEMVQIQKEAEEKARAESKVDLYGETKEPEAHIEVIENDSPVGELEVVDIDESESPRPIPIQAKIKDESQGEESDDEDEEISKDGEGESKDKMPDKSESEDKSNSEEQKSIDSDEKKIEEIIEEKANRLMKKESDVEQQLKDPVQSDDSGESKKNELDEAYEDIEKSKDELFKRKDVPS